MLRAAQSAHNSFLRLKTP